MATTFSIVGQVHGELWWPIGHDASKIVNYTFARKGRPFVDEADTLRDAMESLVTREGGDFSNAPRVEGFLVLTRHTTRRTVTRSFPLDIFPSIRDYIRV